MKDSRSKPDPRPDAVSGFARRVEEVLAGPGSGLPCAHCHQLITVGEIEYEIPEVAEAAEQGAQQPTPRLHVRCYESWRASCGR